MARLPFPPSISAARTPKAKGDVNKLRVEAIKALPVVAEKGDKDALDFLTGLAGQPGSPGNLRTDAMRTLAGLATKDDTKVVEMLTRLSKDETPKNLQLKNAAKDSLSKIEGKK